MGRVTLGAGYTFLHATFESEETVNGESNSTNDEAEEGEPGLEGTIEIEPGDRMPFIPRHMFKAFADVQVTRRLGVDLNVIAPALVRARQREQRPRAGRHLLPRRGHRRRLRHRQPRRPLRADPWLQLIGQVNNLFDREYATGAQLGPAGFTEAGKFLARPLPAIDGEFPFGTPRFSRPARRRAPGSVRACDSRRAAVSAARVGGRVGPVPATAPA